MSPERGTTNIPRFDYLQSDSEFVSRARLPITDVKVHRDPRLTDGPTAKSRPKEKSVNLNTASRTALLDLPGVGPAYADRILAYRASRGLFRTIDELALVKGIGTKRLEKMRPFLTLR